MKMLSFVDGKEYTFLFFTKKKKGIMAIPYVFLDENNVKSSVKLTQEKQDF